MDYQVIFKDSCVEDLERIVRRIAADNPIAARNLGQLIIQMAESLSFFPERHPKVRQRPGVRRWSQAMYRKEILQGVLSGAI
jgi:plasmid stabilization system protein ParE